MLYSPMRIGRAPDGKIQDVPQIKPIMGVVSGKGVVENLDKAQTMDEALLKAADMIKNYSDTSQPVHFLLSYPETREKCEWLKEVFLKKYNCAEL